VTSADWPGFKGDNAFKKSGIWRGKKKDGIFFIGLECDVPDMDIAFVSLRQRGRNRRNAASSVTVQKLDPLLGWTDVIHATKIGKKYFARVSGRGNDRRLTADYYAVMV